MRHKWALGLLVVAVPLACQSLAGIDNLAIGQCKGGQCEPDARADEPPVGTPDSGPQPQVDSGHPCQGKYPGLRVGSPGNTFCIDPKEVSIADYQAFLDAHVDLTKQPALCAWNQNWIPSRPPPVDGGTPPATNEPVAYVDWCDARGYCEWAGKYLCGRVEGGKKTGAVTLEGQSDYRSHQWMLACSAEARLKYPYGAIFDPTRCNLADLDAGGARAVGSLPGCEGGFTGLFDMVGNVWEWYDSVCEPAALEVDGGDGGAQSDGCRLKGGSFNELGATYDCSLDINVRRDLSTLNVGFRCCSD